MAASGARDGTEPTATGGHSIKEYWSHTRKPTDHCEKIKTQTERAVLYLSLSRTFYIRRILPVFGGFQLPAEDRAVSCCFSLLHLYEPQTHAHVSEINFALCVHR